MDTALPRRPALNRLLAMVLSAALLAGCSGLRSVTSDVVSYGDWPAGRAAGSYAFERLPSQQARADETQLLETAAAAALAKAGFEPAAPGREADVLVQIGARETGVLLQLWDDPLWWRGGFGRSRGLGYGPWHSPRWAFGPRSMAGSVDRYEQEVALLLRDRSSGRPLFETRAAHSGGSSASTAVLAAMFEAALADFPRPMPAPHRVSVVLAEPRR